VRLHGWLIGRPRFRSLLRLAVIATALWLVLTEGRAFGAEVLLIIAAAVGAGMYYGPERVHRWRPLELARFLLHFLRGSLRGGIDVAWRVLQLRMPIAPVLIRRRLEIEQGQPRTLLVSAISLMPGTVTADVEGDDLVLHLLSAGMEREIDLLEARVSALFAPGETVEPAP
jgi:multicomponent Na+:H+ antiporter subunit E